MITIPEVSRETDEKFMREALRQARKAYALQEVPIGCVIVYEGQIIARGYNRRNTDRNTISHAEINAIRRASKKLGDWRLEGCTIYITLEPCQMCAGAIVQSRITRAVIGSMNPKAGCAGSVLNLLEMSEFNHQVLVERDVLREQCSDMLSGFFRELREIKKLQKEAARLQVEENSDASAEKAASSQIEMSTTILQENPQETVDE
jgi:tRNA(adenine34) deaminase